MIKSAILNLKNLVENKGQIEGIPKNPRKIDVTDFEKLKRSLIEDPEFMQARELLVTPHGNKFVVIGGNMRYKAIKDIGWSEAPCKIMEFDANDDEKIKTLRLRLLKDNGFFGRNDHDELSANFDEDELFVSGTDMPEIKIEEPGETTGTDISDISTKLIVECADVGQLRDLYIELQNRQFVCTLK